MFNKFVLKVSDRVYKVIDNQDDIQYAKHFLPLSCQIDIDQFLNIYKY